MRINNYQKLNKTELGKLMTMKQNFVISENKMDGAEYGIIEDFPKGELSLGDCKFLTQVISCLHNDGKNANICEYLELIKCDGFSLLVDEDAINHKLEKNDFASMLFGHPIFGSAIVVF